MKSKLDIIKSFNLTKKGEDAMINLDKPLKKGSWNNLISSFEKNKL